MHRKNVHVVSVAYERSFRMEPLTNPTVAAARRSSGWAQPWRAAQRFLQRALGDVRMRYLNPMSGSAAAALDSMILLLAHSITFVHQRTEQNCANNLQLQMPAAPPPLLPSSRFEERTANAPPAGE